VKCFLEAFGHLYQQGVKMDFAAIVPAGRCLPDLPTYPWDHAALYCYKSRVSKEWWFRKYGHRAILGQRIPESTSFDLCWRVVLSPDDESWLSDHKVQQDVVFPLAGYVAMAGEAIRQITGIEAGYSMRHVVAHTAIVLRDSKPVEIVTTLRRHKLTDSIDSSFYDFVISSYSGSGWTKNCEGRAKANGISSPPPPRRRLFPAIYRSCDGTKSCRVLD
jgi:acyl transferase domain-containing protein